MNTIFVYGTLKRAYGNHRYIARYPDHQFIGEAVSTAANYGMIGRGVPMVGEGDSSGIQSKYLGQIKGEVWAVNDESFKAIDNLEGHPYGYCRQERLFKLLTPEAPSVVAWVYLSSYKLHVPHFEFIKPNEAGLLEWNRWPAY